MGGLGLEGDREAGLKRAAGLEGDQKAEPKGGVGQKAGERPDRWGSYVVRAAEKTRWAESHQRRAWADNWGPGGQGQGQNEDQRNAKNNMCSIIECKITDKPKQQLNRHTFLG